MNVGDYVRFRWGEIAKIIDIKRYKTKEDIYFFDKILDFYEDRACNDCTIYENEWKYYNDVKSSPNIIDLIQVGDYVNGYKVISLWKDKRKVIGVAVDGSVIGFDECEIKSIVTKEQFESMEYRVFIGGDDNE